MTIYMKLYENHVEFLTVPKLECYEVVEHSVVNGILFVKAFEKHFEEFCDIFSSDGTIVFDSKEQAVRFCERYKVKNPQAIIKEGKGFFNKKKIYIEKQIVECQDGEVKDIAFKDFPIIDYAGVLVYDETPS